MKHQEPQRTRASIDRIALAKKKKENILRRKALQEVKERSRFAVKKTQASSTSACSFEVICKTNSISMYDIVIRSQRRQRTSWGPS